ncbi:hypothetical protein LX36DRAFT_665058 [Colletotrichum falcatum]|nr:hypothetical protein LX36DRAFT_665058 [Colletotrichum falcatum]
MPPRRRPFVDAYDSDSSFSPSNADTSEDTVANENVSDLYENEDLEEHTEDQVTLFDGNLHTPEYWRNAIENINESDFECPDYSNSMTKALNNIKEQWRL